MRRYAGFGFLVSCLALFIQLAAPLYAARAAEAAPFAPFPICSSPDRGPAQPQPLDHHDSSGCCTLCHLVHALYVPATATPVAGARRPLRQPAFTPHKAAIKAPSRYLLAARPRAPPRFS
ncbi:MAG: DUF2946 family protein [Methylovirgula sp.]